jgi:cell division septal protein FtsQ
MFDHLEKGWAEEDKYSDFARDRIKRQLIKLAVALIFVLGVVLWFLVRKKLRF